MGLFSRPALRLILFAAGGAALVSILTVGIVTGVRNRNGKNTETATETRRLPVEEVNPDDLIIPKGLTEVWRQDWVPFREKKNKWTKEDIEPYWSDTREVLLEVLEKQTVDTLMRNLSPGPPKKGKR